MRKIRKLIGLLLAAAMVFAMNAVAFADDEDELYSITIRNEKRGHAYEAYQIFSGDLTVETVQNDDGTSTETRTLSNIEWGNGVDKTALLSALKGTADAPTAFQDCEDAADVAAVLENYGTDSSQIKAFADIAGQYLTIRSGSSNTCVNGEYTITGLEAGYYLVKDSDNSLPSCFRRHSLNCWDPAPPKSLPYCRRHSLTSQPYTHLQDCPPQKIL